jgi:hypothetical protein
MSRQANKHERFFAVVGMKVGVIAVLRLAEFGATANRALASDLRIKCF